MKISDKLERGFYEKQSIKEKWSLRELKRQKKYSLFLRLADSKDKDGIMELAKQDQAIEKPSDLIREPYVLDFLKIAEPHHLSETELESRIIDELQSFLLEFRKGICFYWQAISHHFG